MKSARARLYGPDLTLQQVKCEVLGERVRQGRGGPPLCRYVPGCTYHQEPASSVAANPGQFVLRCCEGNLQGSWESQGRKEVEFQLLQHVQGSNPVNPGSGDQVTSASSAALMGGDDRNDVVHRVQTSTQSSNSVHLSENTSREVSLLLHFAANIMGMLGTTQLCRRTH